MKHGVLYMGFAIALSTLVGCFSPVSEIYLDGNATNIYARDQTTLPDAFAKLDTNANGYIDTSELSEEEEEKYMPWDTNQDTILSPVEIVAGLEASKN